MEVGAIGNVHVGPAIVVSAESTPLSKLRAELCLTLSVSLSMKERQQAGWYYQCTDHRLFDDAQFKGANHLSFSKTLTDPCCLLVNKEKAMSRLVLSTH